MGQKKKTTKPTGAYSRASLPRRLGYSVAAATFCSPLGRCCVPSAACFLRGAEQTRKHKDGVGWPGRASSGCRLRAELRAWGLVAVHSVGKERQSRCRRKKRKESRRQRDGEMFSPLVGARGRAREKKRPVAKPNFVAFQDRVLFFSLRETQRYLFIYLTWGHDQDLKNWDCSQSVSRRRDIQLGGGP